MKKMYQVAAPITVICLLFVLVSPSDKNEENNEKNSHGKTKNQVQLENSKTFGKKGVATTGIAVFSSFVTSMAAYAYVKPSSIDRKNGFINIDYPLEVTTESGKKIIIRSGKFKILSEQGNNIKVQGDEVTGTINIINNGAVKIINE